MAFISPQHFIEEEEEEEKDGNVKTGLQPWLLNNTEGKDQEIGPTLEDYQRHVACEQKKKLLAGCSSFDGSSARSDSWLPSDGQALHSGRHLNSKKKFEKETKRLTFLGKRAKSEFLHEANSGKPTASQGAEASQLHTKLVVPYQSKRQRSHNTLTCGVSNTSQTSSNITTNYGHVGCLALSAQRSSKPIQNSHKNNNGKTNRNNDNHRYKGFIPPTNLHLYPSKQDNSDVNRGFSPQGHGICDRSLNQMIESPCQNYKRGDSPRQNYKSEQTSDVFNQCEQDITRQLFSPAYKRKKGDNSVLPVPVTIRKFDNALTSAESPTLRTSLISTPLLDKKQ
ncbi:uncharacterized protein LOC110450200 [Mizuhopecten yessoensis]|uniref:uncharacterized protein LOC110450200 n=1 Tax=Mizuhopecten yessoensis TaxID=6573 RepID=UPI000B45DA01|nr:uncharacterized protein LOC110450200 [Mizuhopecten yessoensis]